jgi:hypothetical protein
MSTFLFCVLAGAWVILTQASQRLLGSEGWKRVAKSLGLRFLGFPPVSGPRLRGQLNGLDVFVETVLASGRSWNTVIRIGPVRAIPLDFQLRDERLPARGLSWWNQEPVATGDLAFDARFVVQGDPLETMALLDGRCRAQLLEISGMLVITVQDGRLQGTFPERTEDAAILETLILSLVGIAQSLSLERSEIPRRLLQVVREDPAGEVRRRTLEMLIAHCKDRKEAALAVEAARLDADPRVRVVAALRDGLDGVDALESIARDRDAPGFARAEALRALLQRATAERSVVTLEACLKRSVADDVLHAAIDGLGSLRHAPSAERLVGILRRTSDPETEERVLYALGRIGGGVAEQGILAHLERVEELDRLLPAIEALGRIGTARAVEPLQKRREGLLTASRLKDAAKEAIRQIQSRLGDVDAGRLSLVETSQGSGDLSLAEEPGSLSLADSEEPPSGGGP